MPPNSEDLGSIGFRKGIAGLTPKTKGADQWMDGKRISDDTGGYWRIHGHLYDFSEFMKRHPGGEQWLQITQGTDITEAFEAHHIQATAENLLPKFQVGAVNTPRISPYTFREDGFYRTLKKRVRPLINNLPKDPVKMSAVYSDTLFVLTMVFGVLSCRLWSYWLGVVSAISLGFLLVTAHNYLHQKDNLRMYYFHFGLFNIREWRISHALSHHLFPNTIIDLEMYFLQPFVEYFPRSKPIRYAAWFYSPIFWSLAFHSSFIYRLSTAIASKDRRPMCKTDLIGFTFPLVMYLFGNQDFLAVLGMWTFIMLCGSLHFSIIGINAAHHHPDIFHDGDTPRVGERDWGISQLDAVMDRNDITGSHLLVLTNFGDHALHHLFPTLDHGVLSAIYPVFKKTMKEFGVNLRMTSQFDMVKGQYRQAIRNTPNPNPPDLFRKEK